MGDGTLVTIEADTSLMAAEAVAEWLAASPDVDLAGTVILSPNGDTSLLDAALEARGLPALGRLPHGRGAVLSRYCLAVSSRTGRPLTPKFC